MSECWPVDGTGLTFADERDADDNPLYTDTQLAAAVDLAVSSLRLLTGFRVGGCPVTVRPCRTYPRRTEFTGYGYPAGAGLSGRIVDLDQWLVIGCGCRSDCDCQGVKQIRLFDAKRVDRITIDGFVLDPSAYRLDAGGWLVRTDGDQWPLTQAITEPDTEPGTWSVTYLPAIPVDKTGEYVAGVLAGEYLKAMGDGDCALPPNVTQIVRQGVTLTLAVGAFPDGLTGVREVDAWIQRYNPNRLQAAPMVVSPDVRRPRIVGGGF